MAKNSKVPARDIAVVSAAAAAAGSWALDHIKKEAEKRLRKLPPILEKYFGTHFRELLTWNQDRFDSLILPLCIIQKPLPDLLGDCLFREETPTETKSRGGIVTPFWLANRVARNCVGHWNRLHRSGRQPSAVTDVSCGVGVFLFCFSQLQEQGTSLSGIDKHELSIAYANLLNWTVKKKWKLICKDVLINEEGTLFDFKRTNLPKADILIGNPPYIRSSLLPKGYSDSIRAEYSAIHGNYDLSVAFIEHALENLPPGGIASYILTSKFMSSFYGVDICKRLSSEARLINIEDFQDYQMFPGYTTYTCVLTFAKKPPAKRFLITRFPQGVDGKTDPGTGKTSSLPTARLETHPWDFATDLTHRTLRLLRDPHHPLIGEVFGKIIQGLRTGANNVFVVSEANDLKLKPKLLLRYVSGENIRQCRVDDRGFRLIYPYRRDEFGAVHQLTEEELRTLHPTCWQYFSDNRAVLEERAIDSSCKWYGYSRSQNLVVPFLRKLLVPEMMPRAQFGADLEGELAFCSGYCLDASTMDPRHLKLWTAILCTPTMEFSLRHTGTQLQSGWFRLLKHHLRRVRLPQLNKKRFEKALQYSSDIGENPKNQDALSQLDQVVADTFGLEEQHREIISRFLADCHRRSLGHDQSNTSKTIGKQVTKDVDYYSPVTLDRYNRLHRDRSDLSGLVTFARNKEAPVHKWYKYTQGFSGALVQTLIQELNLTPKDIVLDPFAGCGTTNLVCSQSGIPSIGIEISPVAAWIAQSKVRPWRHRELRSLISGLHLPKGRDVSQNETMPKCFEGYLKKAYSPSVLSQLVSISRYFDDDTIFAPRHRNFLKLGLIGIMENVSQIRKHGSHYRYMLKTESIGLQKLNIQIIDPQADIRPIVMDRLRSMVDDVVNTGSQRQLAQCKIVVGDSRSTSISDSTVSTVITSPPYLNRNNYIAQQKAEMAVLGLIQTHREYRSLVKSTIKSHVESDLPPKPQTRFPEIELILERIELTENNNPKIPNMIAGYFEDIADSLQELRRIMQPGGQAVFVVGNSRWGGVVVPVDHLLLMIAEKQGFKARRVLVTRLKGNSPQQMKRFGRIPVRESIIIFQKP